MSTTHQKKKLSVNIFKPLNWCSNQYRSGIFCFMGGFKIGSPERFYNQSLYFASKAIVFVLNIELKVKIIQDPMRPLMTAIIFIIG